MPCCQIAAQCQGAPAPSTHTTGCSGLPVSPVFAGSPGGSGQEGAGQGIFSFAIPRNKARQRSASASTSTSRRPQGWSRPVTLHRHGLVHHGLVMACCHAKNVLPATAVRGWQDGAGGARVQDPGATIACRLGLAVLPGQPFRHAIRTGCGSAPGCRGSRSGRSNDHRSDTGRRRSAADHIPSWRALPRRCTAGGWQTASSSSSTA